jgi:tetratricopeptide (TPR) repeat protein
MFSLNDFDESESSPATDVRGAPLESEFLRARVLRESGELAKSLSLLRRVLDVRKRELGLEKDDTQFAASQLGRTLRAMGRFDEALRLHKQVLALRLGHYGREHSFTQNSVHILAETYRMAGRKGQARAVEARHGE